jgi:hypothetical protein
MLEKPSCVNTMRRMALQAQCAEQELQDCLRVEAEATPMREDM